MTKDPKQTALNALYMVSGLAEGIDHLTWEHSRQHFPQGDAVLSAAKASHIIAVQAIEAIELHKEGVTEHLTELLAAYETTLAQVNADQNDTLPKKLSDVHNVNVAALAAYEPCNAKEVSAMMNHLRRLESDEGFDGFSNAIFAQTFQSIQNGLSRA